MTSHEGHMTSSPQECPLAHVSLRGLVKGRAEGRLELRKQAIEEPERLRLPGKE